MLCILLLVSFVPFVLVYIYFWLIYTYIYFYIYLYILLTLCVPAFPHVVLCILMLVLVCLCACCLCLCLSPMLCCASWCLCLCLYACACVFVSFPHVVHPAACVQSLRPSRSVYNRNQVVSDAKREMSANCTKPKKHPNILQIYCRMECTSVIILMTRNTQNTQIYKLVMQRERCRPTRPGYKCTKPKMLTHILNL